MSIAAGEAADRGRQSRQCWSAWCSAPAIANVFRRSAGQPTLARHDLAPVLGRAMVVVFLGARQHHRLGAGGCPANCSSSPASRPGPRATAQ